MGSSNFSAEQILTMNNNGINIMPNSNFGIYAEAKKVEQTFTKTQVESFLNHLLSFGKQTSIYSLDTYINTKEFVKECTEFGFDVNIVGKNLKTGV